MILGVHIAVLLVLLALRYRQIDGRISPDGQYYLNMLVGRKVPKPYCYRKLVVWFTKPMTWLGFSEPHHLMRSVVLLGNAVALAGIYALTLSLGGSPWAALAATVVFVMMDGAFGSWVMFPWLVDSWSLGLAAWAAVVDPLYGAILLALSALAKESGWAVGSVFIIAMDPSLYWVPIPGIVALLFTRILVSPAEPDQEWLERPFAYAQTHKRREWFIYRKNLSALKATPFAAAWAIPESVLAVPVAAVCAMAWAQTLVAVDHSRLIGAAAVFLVPAVAVCLDSRLCAGWVLLSLFWPFETEWA